MLGLIGLITANQSSLQQKITMKGRHLCWPPSFFILELPLRAGIIQPTESLAKHGIRICFVETQLQCERQNGRHIKDLRNGICGLSSCVFGSDGWNGTVHARCCQLLANNAAFNTKKVASSTGNGASKWKWAPLTTRDTPGRSTKASMNSIPKLLHITNQKRYTVQ